MRKPRSPYQRHGKKPHRYSDALRHWRHAVLNNLDPSEAAATHNAYIAREFGPMPGWGRRRV